MSGAAIKKTAAKIADYIRLEFATRRRGDYRKLRPDEEKAIRDMEIRVDRGIEQRIRTLLKTLSLPRDRYGSGEGIKVPPELRRINRKIGRDLQREARKKRL